MATATPLFRLSFPAGGNITQYRWVRLQANGTIVQCATDGEQALGVAQLGGVAGDAITVAVYGETKVVFGEVVATGGTVGTLDDGRTGSKQVATGAGADPGDWILGTATAGGGVGEVGTVLLGVPSTRVPV